MRELAFDMGPMALAVARLVGGSPLDTKVEITDRESMVGDGRVMIVRDVTEYAWSSGEEVLWRLLVSLSGAGEVNLGHVISHYLGTVTGVHINDVISAALLTRQIVPGAFELLVKGGSGDGPAPE